MKKSRIWGTMVVVLSFLVLDCYQFAAKDTIPRMTIEELKRLLGDPNVVIIDVRINEDWEKSKLKIKGAVREDPEKFSKEWADRYPRGKTLVFYCD